MEKLQISLIFMLTMFLYKLFAVFSIVKFCVNWYPDWSLKVHKIENFFGSKFEFYTISLLVILKY
jgi:hypothetical protein